MFNLDCDLKKGLGGVLAAVERFLRKNRKEREKPGRKAPVAAVERKAPETEAERAFYAAMGWQQGDWDRADWRDFTS